MVVHPNFYMPNPTKIRILSYPHPISCRRASEVCWSSPDMVATSLPACEKSRCRRGLSHFWHTGLRTSGFCSAIFGFLGTGKICNTPILNTVVNFRTTRVLFCFSSLQAAHVNMFSAGEAPTTQFKLHGYGSVAASAEFMVGNGKDSSGFRQVGRAKSFRRARHPEPTKKR